MSSNESVGGVKNVTVGLLRALLSNAMSSTDEEDGTDHDHPTSSSSFSTYTWSLSPPASEFLISPTDEAENAPPLARRSRFDES